MKKLSWRVKLMMLFVGILSASLLFKIFFAVPYIRNQEIEKTKIYQEEIAQNISREMNVGLDRIKDELSRMSILPEFRNMNIDEMQGTIMQLEKLSERISTVAIMNSEGIFVCGSMKDLSANTTQSYANRPYFTIPFDEGKTYFTSPLYYAKENLLVTLICIPIESESGDRAGVLIGEMDLNDIIKRVADYLLAEGQVACIIDNKGTVLAHSNIDLFALDDGPLSLNYSKWPMVQAIINGGRGGSQEYTQDGSNYYGTYSVIESNDWGVVVVASMDSILAGSNTMIRTILFINLLFFAIALIFTIIFSRQITVNQREADKMLQKSEEKFRTVADYTYDWEYWFDPEGKIIFISPSCERITGYRPEEFLQNPKLLKDIVHSDDAAIVKNHIHKVSGTDEIIPIDFRITTKSKEVRWIAHVCQTVYDNNGVYIGQRISNRDITERKKAEENLKIQKEFSEKIINTSNAIIVGLNKNHKIQLFNEGAEKITGYKSNNVLGKDWFKIFFPPEIIDEMNKVWKDSWGIKARSFINLIRTKNGNGKIISWQTTGMYEGKDEKNHLLISIGEDITERKQMEEKLHESQEQYRQLVENANDIIFRTDIDGTFTYINAAGLRILEYSEEEIIGKNYRDLVCYEYRKNSERFYLLQLARKISHTYYEFPILTKQGKKIWFGQNTRLMKEANRFIGFQSISRNITDRKQAEEALKESEDLLNNITSSAKDGIIVNDNDDNVIFWNSSAEKIFGYKAEEITGKKFHEIIVPIEYHEAYRKGFSKFKKTGKGNAIGATLELEALNKIGQKFPVELSLSAMKIHDQWNSVGIIRDISQRKVIEEKLEEAKTNAENANQAKSDFLANMSHEIRTPMNAILGFAEILDEQLGDNPQYHDYVTGIRNSGKGLLGLINDILDLSKIEAGKLDINYEPINPLSIIEEIRQIFLRKTNEKKLDFAINVDPKLPQGLIFDETRLRQVLFNLIGNAVKFTGEGGICVNVKSEDSNAERSHVDLSIEIIDTGIGIPESEQQIIFEPFRQKEGQSNRKYGGTGLGLSITQRLVKIMGGTIGVQSTTGRGSTFTVFLPGIQVAALSEINPGQDEETLNISFQDPLILLVEDIESNRKVIRGLLNTQNITIIEAENGSIGIEKAKEHVPDLILMDMQMPVIDGYEATRLIKSDKKLKNIPVVALTASSMKRDATEIARLCDGYLCKPVSKSQLLSELKKFLPYKEEKLKIEGSADHKTKFFKELKQRLSGDNHIPDEFARVFNHEIIPEYHTLLKNRSGKRIRNFAELIAETGRKLNMEMIEAYGKELHVQVAAFNVQRINSMLEEFEEMTKLIKEG